MKTVSAIALLAALCFCTPAFAQSATGKSTTNSNVTVQAGGANVTAGATTGVNANAGTNGAGTSASASAAGDASASASAGGTGASSSAEATASSAVAGGEDCSNGGRLQTAAIDSTALAAVTTVNVELVSNCSGLAQLDGSAAAALSANSKVAAAVQAAGGAEVVGYDMEGTTLTVFAKKSS